MRPILLAALFSLSAFAQDVIFLGQPTAEQLAEYAKSGVKTVINLRTPGEMEKVPFDEKSVVEKAGMRYVHVPFSSPPPTDEELRGVMKALDAAKPNNKVLLHCASSFRVGYVWGLFQSQQKDAPLEKAIEEARKAGMKSPALEKNLRERLK